ncbi:MAG: undecaprenyldiphospho-muramoylpentapeptide beta-N-acetylglucosaminyltransferase [Clostridia bacterium]|nr:undecaprenyldiphospho-muramoylpentapeptide beta-N-acetylglucosaminyltransferase [Clostridia bacterium]MBR4261136.1 undecaprenyldiphospho-muramoylpentapeptide beta-N-acetylglucosaminyltransferase [Clostridia bacterium]
MRVIISAAGTGGHINPGIAIANKIKQEEPDSEIIFIGTSRGLETDLVPRAGYELKTIEAYGLKKELSITNIKNMIKTATSTSKAKKYIKEFNPDVVIGTGGYICGPVFAAATAYKIPSVLHESNAYPGKAVKMFAKRASKVLVGFEAAKERLPMAKEVVVTGTPTKVEKIELTEERKQELFSELKLDRSLPIVLVFGGSQGAKRINDAIIGMLKENKINNYQLVWATGPKQFEVIEEELKTLGMDINNLKNCRPIPYIYNMDEMYALSDLIVARSGAMTITELAITCKPAVFIPLPSVGANRQEDNARVVESLGGAEVILNSELDSVILSEKLDRLTSNLDNLKQMGMKVNLLEIKNVEDKIYKEIKKVIQK